MINHDDIQYKVLTEPCQEIIDLLSNTIYGTKGLRYGHQNVKKRVYRLENPHFHTLWLEDKLLAVAAYCHRELGLEEKIILSIYIRYFAVNKNCQGEGLGRLLTQNLYHYYDNSIREESVFYAYIEQKNARSMGVSKRFKQEKVGEFKTIYFSRFFPKKNKNVSPYSKEKATHLLKQNEQKYAFYGNFKLGYEDGYRVLKKKGEIVAGIQANKITWDIHNLPGFMGWVTRNVLHFLPVIGRLSPRKSFSFLTFEGVFIEPGHEKDLLTLMEHCLAEQKIYSAILPLDVKDDLFNTINNLKGLGLMHKIQHAPPVSILVNFYHTDKSTEQAVRELPKYISGFDIS